MGLTLKEEKIYRSIKVRSENDPNKPEFPPDNPHWPSTPTYQIEVPGFKNVWLKDESVNPTGTHKDRMAWEIVVTYKEFLRNKKLGYIDSPLPNFSILTSGSAGIAIATQLNKYKLPKLKCLVDEFIDEKYLRTLSKLNCDIYKVDLTKKAYNSEDILEATENPNGVDITSNIALDPTMRFYDWLSYDVINKNADYVFIPFGTGQLYENILNIAKREITTKNHDPRFRGSIKKLRGCHYMGSTTHYPRTKADKLYAHHLPFSHFEKQWINFYKFAGYCGNKSHVYTFKEELLDKAMDMATENGVNCEPSGAAGLALLLQMRNEMPKNKKILIINTGKTKLLDWE